MSYYAWGPKKSQWKYSKERKRKRKHGIGRKDKR